MSTRSMKSTQENERNRRLSGSSSDRIISYADDTSIEISHEPPPDYYQRTDNCHMLCPSEDRTSFYPRNSDTIGFQLDEHSAFYLSSPDDEQRPNVSCRSKTGNLKQTRNNSELDQRSSRRSSVQSSRSRTNSCSRPTPLGRRQLGHQTLRSMRNAHSSLPFASSDVTRRFRLRLILLAD